MNNLYEIILGFLMDNLLGLFSFLFTLAALILMIILYFRGKKEMAPCFTIRNYNVFVDYKTKLKDLEIKYLKRKIETLTVTKIAFWNAGKGTIKKEDIAKKDPITIHFESSNEKAKILDIEVIMEKNSINQFSVNKYDDGSHAFINFEFLDHNEGGIIQVIHTGKLSDYINVKGTIIGGKRLKRKSLGTTTQFGKVFIKFLFLGSNKRDRLKLRRSFGLAMIMAAVLVFFLMVFAFIQKPEIEKDIIAPIIAIIFMILIYLSLGISILKRKVPKGFEIFEEYFDF